jgi:hypothetical protein
MINRLGRKAGRRAVSTYELLMGATLVFKRRVKARHAIAELKRSNRHPSIVRRGRRISECRQWQAGYSKQALWLALVPGAPVLLAG